MMILTLELYQTIDLYDKHDLEWTMILLKTNGYQKAAPLLYDFTFEPLMQCMMDGIIKGYIYLNDLTHPDAAYAQFRHRAFINGDINAVDSNAFLDFIRNDALLNCKKDNVPLLRLTPHGSQWLDWLTEALAPLSPDIVDYQTYAYELDKQGCEEAAFPPGFELHATSKALVESEFEGKKDLLEEMISERNTVAGFLRNSFGIVAFHEGRLAGWCLSEYNHDTRCAVGIATMPPFRRKGIARNMTLAFLNLAREHNVKTVLWHCYKSNIGSGKTALSAGFNLADEHKVLNIYL